MTGNDEARLRTIADEMDGIGRPGTAKALREIADGIGSPDWWSWDLGDAVEALRWVADRGGLDAVKEQRRESIPRAAYERKKAGWLDHIEECEEALARRNGRIAELKRERDKLRDEAAWAESLSGILDGWADLLGFPEQKGDPGKITSRVGAVLDGTWRRLMPEGMEWPRTEEGEPVRPGDRLLDKGGDWFKAVSFVFTCDWWSVRGYQTEGFGDLNDKTRRKLEGMAYGTCVKRPAPKVLAADGVEIHVGDEVFVIETGKAHHVTAVDPIGMRFKSMEQMGGDATWLDPPCFTHRAPVLAADGRPLREGETVWHKSGLAHGVVESIDAGSLMHTVRYRDESGVEYRDAAKDLTHERPDSWERLEEDAGNALGVMRGGGAE